MTAHVQRGHMCPQTKRRQNGLVGHGIEAIGMQKQAIYGANWVSEGDARKATILQLHMKPTHIYLTPEAPP